MYYDSNNAVFTRIDPLQYIEYITLRAPAPPLDHSGANSTLTTIASETDESGVEFGFERPRPRGDGQAGDSSSRSDNIPPSDLCPITHVTYALRMNDFILLHSGVYNSVHINIYI